MKVEGTNSLPSQRSRQPFSTPAIWSLEKAHTSCRVYRRLFYRDVTGHRRYPGDFYLWRSEGEDQRKSIVYAPVHVDYGARGSLRPETRPRIVALSSLSGERRRDTRISDIGGLSGTVAP